jgi:glycerol-3-phosphate acyltransferase PlsX
MVPSTRGDRHARAPDPRAERKAELLHLGRFSFIATGKIDAFISAGNTGAMLVGSLLRTEAPRRCSSSNDFYNHPKENGGTGLLLDVGLNSDCKPEQLNQFA